MWEDPDIREEEGLLEHLTEAEKADIERRVTLFDVLSREFTCELGKVGYTIEHLTINYLIYIDSINSNRILFNIITITTILFDTLSFNQIFFFCQVESRKERNERGLKDINLTYGEIEFKSFFQVFKWIQKTWKDKDPDCWHNAFNVAGGTFVDLGHGTGKGILSGAFMHQFERCWGIEILESLNNVSINLKAVYETYINEVESAEYQ